MATTAPEPEDRFPTAGPSEAAYETCRFDTTADGEAIIYDDREANAWIQAAWAVSLEAWR